MQHDNRFGSPMHTRRRFLGLTAGAAAGLGTAGLLPGTTAPAVAADAADAPAAKRSGLKLGLASYTLKEFTLDETIRMTRRVGLEHICLKSFHLPLEAPADEIAQAAAKVRDAGLDLYGGGVITMRTEADVEQAFAYAKAAGMRVIVAAPMPDVLPLVNRKVQQLDIQVAIHNHGPGDKVYPTPESAYERVKDLDPRLGLCIDIGHTVRIGADPHESARKYADRLLDVHIKDVTAAAPAGRTVECGRGVIDIPRFLRVLLEIGYSGIVSFEHEKDMRDPLPGLAESVGYVRGALAVIEAA
jgi:inosose dehydratase